MANPTGQFSVSNGQIIDPNGNPFVARGIDVFPGQVDAATILNTFPGINAIRLAATPGTNPNAIDSLVQGLTSKGVVVLIEDHSSSGGNPNTLSGQALANEASWYAGLAGKYQNNPDVWFGTANEPDNSANLQAIPDQEKAIYDAIRGTGSKAMVMLEERGSGYSEDAVAQSPGTYASMTNVAWDTHYYGWVSGYSTDPSVIAKSVQSQIAAAQSVRSADGLLPVIIGEYGPSTTGLAGYDANGLQVVQAVDNSGKGTFAWAYNAGTDALTDNNGNLTDFGQMVAKHIAAGASTPTLPVPTPTNPNPTNPGTTAPPAPIGAGADTLVLNLSEDAYQGDAQFTLTVDGKQLGPVQSVTALHRQGQSEAFTFHGDWGAGPHPFGVAFVNDAWGGTDTTDRNLYIDGATFDGNQAQSGVELKTNGTVTFSKPSAQQPPSPPASTPSVPASNSEAVPNGAATVPAATAGDNTAALGSGGSSIPNGLALTFDDEFNSFSSSPDGSSGTWTTTYPFGGETARTLPGNHEAEFYSDPSVGENPFSVGNGVLTISATPAASGSNPYGLPYDSGVITTENSFAQQYGYFEMRAQLPAGQGLWPAFWMIPKNGSYSAELDVLEQLGNDPKTIYATLHDWAGGDAGTSQKILSGPDASTGFHTYGVDWEPDTTTFYEDGQAVGSVATPASMKTPMIMMANLAVGGAGSWPGAPNGSTKFPANMQIDYIRAYATANTTNVSGRAALANGGTAPPPAPSSPLLAAPIPLPTVGSGADTLVLNLSEDAYQGDAQFTLTVDGKQLGPADAVTAAHGGQPEAFTFKGDWGSGTHSVGISFSNPSFGSSANQSRNLYLNGATFDGNQVQGETPITGSSPVKLTLALATRPPAPPAPGTLPDPAVPSSGTMTVTDDSSSSATVALISTGSHTDHPSSTSTITQTVSNGADTLKVAGSVKGETATLGSGTQKLILVNPRSMVLTAGSGIDTVTAKSGNNQFVVGSGSLTVTGGFDATSYVLHAGSGQMTVTDFNPSKGDTLKIDKALQGALKQVSDGHGGTMLTFGTGQGSIDLINHAPIVQSNLNFV